jgi:AraC-like DNA-binding protein
MVGDMAESNGQLLRPALPRAASDAVPMIDANFVVMAYRALQAHGVDADAALAEAEIGHNVLADQDARIPFRLNVEMLEVAARRIGDACFGLHLGAAIDSKDVGVLGYVALSSATVADAINHVQRYFQVLTSGEIFDARTEGDRLVIEYRVLDRSAQHCRQSDDLSLMTTVRLMQIATGKQVRPEWVEFKHSEPAQIAEYRRLFGAPVRFGGAINALGFPISVLDLPIQSADRQLLDILEGYCQSVLQERRRTDDLAQQVEEMVMRLLPDGPPKAETVARALGMSTRTLSRRLKEQGKTYRDLVDEMRAGLAERYLQDRNLRLTEIAYLLGYADLSAFNHAFNRWTGKSPSEFR